MILEYKGQEALDMVKEYYPHNWKVLIAEKKQVLLKIMKAYKSTPENALRKFIEAGCTPEASLLMFSALHQLLTEKEYKKLATAKYINELRDGKERIKKQVFALGDSTGVEAQQLRTIYTEKLAQLQGQINEHINSFEVVSPIFVIDQPGLFDNANRSDN